MTDQNSEKENDIEKELKKLIDYDVSTVVGKSTLEFFKRLKDANLTVFDLIKNNTATKIENGKDGKIKIEEFELDDDFKNIDKDFKEIISKLKQLDINIYNLVQFYDCHEIEGNDWDLVYDTIELLKQATNNIEKLSFLKFDLDPRIKARKDIFDCFSVNEAKCFIGKNGYFSNDIESFKDLELCLFDCLKNAYDDRPPFENNDGRCYRFFFPHEKV